MPESGGVVDRLVIATEFDESGLDRGTKAQLAHLERFVAQVGQISRTLPPISLDASQVTTALQQAGGDLEAFTRILGQLSPTEFVTALDQMVQELGEAGGQFKATSAEGRAFHAAIEALKVAQGQAGAATQGVVSAFGQEAGAARLAANAATDLASALVRTGVATRQLAAQGSQPLTLNVQPAINAADTLISRMGLAQRSVASVRMALATPLPPIRSDPNLPILARGYEGFAHRAEEARQAAERLKQTMLGQGAAARHTAADNAAAAAAIGRLGADVGAVGTGFVAAGAGASRLRAGLSGLAVTASGTSPAIAQVVSGLLLLSAGSVAVLGIAAGVAAVATAINALEGPFRRARKETEDLVETLKRARIGRLPEFEQVGLQIDDLRGKMIETTGQIQRLRVLIAQAPVTGALFRRGELEANLANLANLNEEMGALVRLRSQLQVAGGEELIRGLDLQIANFGKTGAEAQRLAIALDTSLLPAQRRDALARADTIIGLERQAKALEEATKRAKELAVFQEAFAADLKAVMGRAGDLGAPAMILKPQLDLSEIRTAVEQSQAAFAKGLGDDEIERARLAGLGLADAMAEVGLSLKDIGNANIAGGIRDARTEAEKFADTLADAADLLGAIGEFGASTGFFSEQDLRAFQTFQDAATSIGKFASGDIVGGLVAAIQTLGGIFGGGESEHDRIVRENTEAIARNTAAKSDIFAGIGGTEELARSIEQVITENLGAVALAANDIGTIRTTGSAILEREFLALGVSLEDLQRVAEANGLNVLDEKGRLVGGALEQLRAQLLDVVQRSLEFANTLSDLTLAGDLRARITGAAVDPTAEFQRTILAAGELGASEISRFFEGVDLGDPDALRRASLGLLDAFENGQLDASKLGKLSREDILRILGDAAGLIESLGESALDAANELSIIPKGFRAAALAFEAQIPGLGPNTVGPVLKAVDIPLVDLAVDATDALERLIPQPIHITGAELLDRLVAFGVIPASTALPAGLPSDGAALPEIAASLGSATSALAQIAASLTTTRGASAAETQVGMQETNAILTRMAELLNKAKVGTTVNGDIILELPSTGQDPREQALDVRRALEDISMADYGRTDRWGQT